MLNRSKAKYKGNTVFGSGVLALSLAVYAVRCSDQLWQVRESAHLPSARIATSGGTTSGFAYVPPMLPMLETVKVPPTQGAAHHEIHPSS